MDPILTVIIPVYNGRAYLRSAVQSVLAERLPSLEVLVVDDGSEDDSLETVADLPVQTIRIAKNSGQAVAQNIGVSNAKGEFICFLDSDDVMANAGLHWRLEWLLKNEAEELIAGRVAGIIDSRGESIGSYRNILNPAYRTPPSYISMRYLQSGGEFPSQVWTMLFRRNFLQKIGPFDETLRTAHDNDFFYRILSRAYIPFVNRSTVFYRLHEGNRSGTWNGSQFQLRREALAENLLVHLSNGLSPKN